MARLEVKRHMGPLDIAAVSELLEVAAQVDHHHPLGEHQWLDLVQGGREGFAGFVATEPGHDHPVGYAQLTRGAARNGSSPGGSWALEYVIDPHHRASDPEIGRSLLDAALDLVRTEGGGHVHLWVPKPTALHDQTAAAVGLRRGRELCQLRRDLPVGVPYDLHVRPFRPGLDEGAWLDVNNRAFDRHPEQGGWDLATLANREAQDWFDPAGFLLHERDGRLAAFCWTKVHRHTGLWDHDPWLGEIYVIAVDPDFQGLGLGRSVALAGLDWLAQRGIGTGMLYVDRGNAQAMGLYASLGFTVDHVDQAYVGDYEPAGGQPGVSPAPTSEPSP